MPSMIPGADTGGVDRVDIHPPFFSKKKFEMSLYLKLPTRPWERGWFDGSLIRLIVPKATCSGVFFS